MTHSTDQLVCRVRQLRRLRTSQKTLRHCRRRASPSDTGSNTITSNLVRTCTEQLGSMG